MKLKYYLRGLGIGLIITTMILTISNNVRFANAQFEGQLAQNETTGSVIAFTTAAAQPESETTQPDQTASSDGAEATTVSTVAATQAQTEKTTVSEPAADGEKVTVTLKDIYYATQAADLLYEAGVITDRGEFIQYMQDSGYATRIKEGEYEIAVGARYEDIAKIITRTE